MLVRRRHLHRLHPLSSSQRAALSLGWPSVGHQGGFRNEREQQRAWEEHREELIAEARRGRPGHRPWAWWHYEAGRKEHLTGYPPFDRGMTIEERRDAIDDFKIEPIVSLASRGELSEDEIAEIEAEAREVEQRIGTEAEHWGSDGVDYPDRRAVKLARAVGRRWTEVSGRDHRVVEPRVAQAVYGRRRGSYPTGDALMQACERCGAAFKFAHPLKRFRLVSLCRGAQARNGKQGAV